MTIKLEDGGAEYMGDDVWVIDQVDETLLRGPVRRQRAVLTRSDLEQMLAAVA